MERCELVLIERKVRLRMVTKWEKKNIPNQWEKPLVYSWAVYAFRRGMERCELVLIKRKVRLCTVTKLEDKNILEQWASWLVQQMVFSRVL